MIKIHFWKYIFPVRQYYFWYIQESESVWFNLFWVKEIIQLWEKLNNALHAIPYETGITDLAIPLDTIIQSFSSTKRNEINRANKEGIQYENVVMTKVSYDLYRQFYNQFASERKLPLISWDFFYRFSPYIVMNRAFIENETIVYHLYIRDDNYIRLFQSCSLFREKSLIFPKNFVSWANNWLHFFDIDFAQKSNCITFDWWGIFNWEPNSPDSIQKLKISQFKLGFSPNLVTQWNYIQYWKILKFFISIFR